MKCSPKYTAPLPWPITITILVFGVAYWLLHIFSAATLRCSDFSEFWMHSRNGIPSPQTLCIFISILLINWTLLSLVYERYLHGFSWRHWVGYASNFLLIFLFLATLSAREDFVSFIKISQGISSQDIFLTKPYRSNLGLQCFPISRLSGRWKVISWDKNGEINLPSNRWITFDTSGTWNDSGAPTQDEYRWTWSLSYIAPDNKLTTNFEWNYLHEWGYMEWYYQIQNEELILKNVFPHLPVYEVRLQKEQPAGFKYPFDDLQFP